jgi:hypothetical protein
LFLPWLLLLLFLCPRALRAFCRVLVRLGFAVLVPLFPLLRFGPRLLLPFLLGFLFPAVALVVCVVWLVPLFLPLRFSRLRPLASVVVRSLLVRLRWFVPLLRVVPLFGSRSLRLRALLVSFPLLFRLVVFVVWVRVRGLRLRSPAVRGFLLCCSCPRAFALLLVGVSFRWAVVFSFVRSSL